MNFQVYFNTLTGIDVDPTKLDNCVEILQRMSDRDIIPLKELLSFEYTVNHEFSILKIKLIYRIDKQNTCCKYI